MAALSAREFDQDVSAAKRAAASAPVIVTERGRPSHVLLSIEQYERLVGNRPTIVGRLSIDDEIDFEPETLDLAAAPFEL